jgi:hypothetical protein
MTEQREIDLLIDLLKLMRKYGSQSFELLANDLSSSQITERLSRILTKVPEKARAAPKTRKSQRTKQQQPIPKALMALEHSDPQKFEILSKFYRDLVTKTVLPSLRDIKYLAEELGLPEIRAESRQKAISPLITMLAVYPLDKIKEKIQSVDRYRTGDRSLEGWSKIILDKEKT